MVPSWVDNPPPEAPQGDDATAQDDTDGEGDAAKVPTPPAVPLAPDRRWLGVRRSLGDFASSGDTGKLRTGFGRYARDGYGGSRTAARRMGSTAATAGALGSALDALAAGQPIEPGSPLDPALLAGRSVDEIMDAVVEAVRPVDGTQDAEASRAAIRDALAELLTRFPNADLLGLTPEQREFTIERFTAHDVFRRFDLDVGQSIREKAPNVTTGLARLKQARDYVKETVAAAFRKLREGGKAFTAGRVSAVVRDALRETFDVFEGYAE
ncbi:Qat anti-phage system associated protein QatB [Novosphingobium sp. CECT 9465]|uniref:Qat anti-phage system associated protein QatB n=1 Tax=Novosphingobium sp. CECT 9465 TaxID=2829794 RepID=UPI00273A36C7|nr:Qat anti-phage system associated protein QatB [Novosphingobium sp. CECT 9465]